MKDQLGAFVLLTASTAALAQSRVTRYGRVDGGIEHDPGSHAMLYAPGTTCNLSARTFLYGIGAYVGMMHVF